MLGLLCLCLLGWQFALGCVVDYVGVLNCLFCGFSVYVGWLWVCWFCLVIWRGFCVLGVSWFIGAYRMVGFVACCCFGFTCVGVVLFTLVLVICWLFVSVYCFADADLCLCTGYGVLLAVL